MPSLNRKQWPSSLVSPEMLMRLAVDAREKAYAPYSGFRVGAACLSDRDEVAVGCNVENASYGLTICAERTAIGAAVAAGKRHFTAIAVVAGGQTTPVPCGACLQVLTEFCKPDFLVIVASATRPAVFQTYRLKDLLPHAFALRGQKPQL